MTTKRCPTCSSETAIRIILYGMPMGEPDYDIYTRGGCVIIDGRPKYECIECGWKGSRAELTSFQSKRERTKINYPESYDGQRMTKQLSAFHNV